MGMHCGRHDWPRSLSAWIAIVSVAVCLGVSPIPQLGSFPGIASGQAPGGPVLYQCGRCGRWNTSPNCPYCRNGVDDPPPPQFRVYGVVTLANRTEAAVNYSIRCLNGGGWSNVNLAPDKTHFHWHRPTGKFQIQFTQDGVKRNYTLDANEIRGRVPGEEEGRFYAFESTASGFDLHTASRTPPHVKPPLVVKPPLDDPQLVRAREMERFENEGADAFRREDYETSLARYEEALRIARLPSMASPQMISHESYHKAMICQSLYHLGLRAFDDGKLKVASEWLDRAAKSAIHERHREMIATTQREVAQRLEIRGRAIELFNQGVAAGKRGDYHARLAYFEASLKLSPNDRDAQDNVRLAKEAVAEYESLRNLWDNNALQVAKDEFVKPTEQTPLEDPELALLLAGEFLGSRQQYVLQDPELALLLAGEYQVLQRAGALNDTELQRILGAEPQVLDAVARREKALGLLSESDMAVLSEAEVHERIRRRHDLRLDEATRIMSREWSVEMRRLENIGMISPAESVLAKETNDPKYAQALRDAKDKVWAHFQELKKVADDEARREFLTWSVVSGANEQMIQEMIRAEITLAWIATKKFQAANARFDEASVEACLDLIRTGGLRRGELIVQQLQDPVRRRLVEERIDPLRQKLWQERRQILDEHRAALTEASDKVQQKYLGLADGG